LHSSQPQERYVSIDLSLSLHLCPLKKNLFCQKRFQSAPKQHDPNPFAYPLSSDQVNLLARNARLQLLNAKVNMYCGFMRLQVDEDDETIDPSEKPSITAIQEDGDEDGMGNPLDQDGDKADMGPDGQSYPRRGGFVLQQSVFDSAGTSGEAGSMFSAATSSHMSSASSISSGSSSTSLSSHSLSSSTSSSPSSSRDQLDVEMRLGTGGSVPLMEYYRTIELTYFSTVEPVGR